MTATSLTLTAIGAVVAGAAGYVTLVACRWLGRRLRRWWSATIGADLREAVRATVAPMLDELRDELRAEFRAIATTPRKAP